MERIAKLGGSAYYEYQLDWSDDNPPHRCSLLLRNAVPPGPPGLRAVLGENFFADVVCVWLGETSADIDLECIEGMSRLLLLGLHCPQVTDNGLCASKGLPGFILWISPWAATA